MIKKHSRNIVVNVAGFEVTFRPHLTHFRVTALRNVIISQDGNIKFIWSDRGTEFLEQTILMQVGITLEKAVDLWLAALDVIKGGNRKEPLVEYAYAITQHEDGLESLLEQI